MTTKHNTTVAVHHIFQSAAGLEARSAAAYSIFVGLGVGGVMRRETTFGGSQNGLSGQRIGGVDVERGAARVPSSRNRRLSLRSAKPRGRHDSTARRADFCDSALKQRAGENCRVSRQRQQETRISGAQECSNWLA